MGCCVEAEMVGIANLNNALKLFTCNAQECLLLFAFIIHRRDVNKAEQTFVVRLKNTMLQSGPSSGHFNLIELINGLRIAFLYECDQCKTIY
jgi:hypothetical protein